MPHQALRWLEWDGGSSPESLWPIVDTVYLTNSDQKARVVAGGDAVAIGRRGLDKVKADSAARESWGRRTKS